MLKTKRVGWGEVGESKRRKRKVKERKGMERKIDRERE